MDKESFDRVAKLAFGHIPLQALYVAVELRITEKLSDQSKAASELAKDPDVDSDFLERILKCLVSHGIFIEENRQFKNNRCSEFLGADHPFTLAPTIKMYGANWAWNAWGNLLEAVKSGKSSFLKTHSKPLFDFLSENEAASRIFDHRMNGKPERRLIPLLDNYDFSGHKKIVDVGGGQGGILFGILEKYPKLAGVLFDLGQSICRAKEIAKSRNLDTRCDCIEGSFFESVPAGGDLYLLAIVLHDWNDADCIKILKNCRNAISEGGKLLILERIVADSEKQPLDRLIDLEMMVMTEGGRERTKEQFENLFSESGFKLEKALPAEPMSILIANPKT